MRKVLVFLLVGAEDRTTSRWRPPAVAEAGTIAVSRVLSANRKVALGVLTFGHAGRRIRSKGGEQRQRVERQG